jgi:nucleoside phosphorylase/CheY-like chemotaxis protein
MIKVLVVEDDDAKAAAVEGVVLEIDPAAVCQRERNVADAVAAARSGDRYDLMVLDLLMPMRAGGELAPEGGLRALDALVSRYAGVRIGQVVALTSFDELAGRQEQKLRQHGVLVLRYGLGVPWEDELSRILLRIVDSGSGGREEGHFDALFVTALDAIELDGVLSLPLGWREMPDVPGVHVGTIGGDLRRRCLALACPEMGMPVAAAVVGDAIHRYRPRVVVMTGIAAGIGDSMDFGDILVADVVWDYGAGKLRGDGRGSRFSPAPSQRRVDESIVARVRATRRRGTGHILEQWRGAPVPARPPRVHVGPLASGAAVVADESVVEQIRGYNRKVIGVEMEAYGVVVAAQTSSAPRPSVMICKSVCDFGTFAKGDDYQAYAAFTSARFALDVLEQYPLK